MPKKRIVKRYSGSEEGALYHRVDELLYYKWDPLNVSDNPKTRDEYQDYVDQICQALIDGDTAAELTIDLDNIRIDRMGLSADLNHSKAIAELLTDTRETLKR